MFWRMIGWSLVRQRGRRFLIAVTVALGTTLATAILSVMLDVGDKVNAELTAYGANIVVRPQGAAVVDDLYSGLENQTAGPTLAQNQLTKIKTIFWAYNIVDFTPFLSTTVSLHTSGAAKAVDVQAVGTWFDQKLDLPTGESATESLRPLRSWWSVRGAWPGAGSADDVMVGVRLAAQEGIRPGDHLTISAGRTSAQVVAVGVFDSGDDESDELVAPLALVQKLSGQAGRVGWVEVAALTTPDNDLARRAAQDPDSLSARDRETWYCTAYVSSISYQLEEAITGSVAKPVRQVADSEGLVLSKTSFLMMLITGLALAATALGIANLVTVSVMERAAEIGLLKALGASGRAVVGLILTETLVVALAGGIVGFGAGFGVAQAIGQIAFGSSIDFRPLSIPVMAAFVVGVTAIGSLPAIRLLTSLRPAEVLHGR